MNIDPESLGRAKDGVGPALRQVVSGHDRTAGGAAEIYAEVAITVRRPRAEVAAVMFDPRHDSTWINRVARAVPDSMGPARRGMKIVRDWRWLGRQVTDAGEVVDCVPNRLLEVAVHLPFGVQRIRYELEGIPEGTIARVRVDGRANGWRRFLAPAASELIRFGVIRDLRRLKALLESGASRRAAG